MAKHYLRVPALSLHVILQLYQCLVFLIKVLWHYFWNIELVTWCSLLVLFQPLEPMLTLQSSWLSNGSAAGCQVISDMLVQHWSIRLWGCGILLRDQPCTPTLVYFLWVTTELLALEVHVRINHQCLGWEYARLDCPTQRDSISYTWFEYQTTH